MNCTPFLKITVLASLTSCMMAACGEGSETSTKDTVTTSEKSKEVAEEKNDAKFNKPAEKDAQFLVDAYSSGLMEVKAATNAAVKATNKDVKDFAAMLVAAHEKVNGQIQTTAASKNISLPTGPTDSQNSKLTKWMKETGHEYDKDFIDMMVSGHKDGVNLYEKIASDATDADIKAWAAQTLPDLRKHLDIANATWDKIKNMK
ncbi:MAG: DUF4142 domain-containing protein [Chitinophagaceae bacterium]